MLVSIACTVISVRVRNGCPKPSPSYPPQIFSFSFVLQTGIDNYPYRNFLVVG
jgi:hypothetical protein